YPQTKRQMISYVTTRQISGTSRAAKPARPWRRTSDGSAHPTKPRPDATRRARTRSENSGQVDLQRAPAERLRSQADRCAVERAHLAGHDRDQRGRREGKRLGERARRATEPSRIRLRDHPEINRHNLLHSLASLALRAGASACMFPPTSWRSASKR